jgi:transposase
VFLEEAIQNSVPSQPSLGIRRIVQDGKDVRLDAEVLGESARCPACQTESFKVHDRYKRRPMDLPWRGRKARMVVTVRRFRCVNRRCKRKTFAQDCGPTLVPLARRTAAADETLLDVARTAGGEGGSRMAGKVGMPVSPDTMLRLLRRAPLPVLPTPRVLGIDDLALRRRYSYATLLVDLETHRPVDLVEDRDAETLAGWLKEHPGVGVISRDRSGAYADGATAGAPAALQVADRFHLLQNASNALDGMLRGRRLAVEVPEPLVKEPQAPRIADVEPAPKHETTQVEEPLEKPLSPTKRYEAERRAARIVRWERVRDLHQAGMSVHQISREVGIARLTVRRLIATPAAPRNQTQNRRPGGLSSPTLAPYASHLQDRWQQGCTNVAQLLREIQAQGYQGSRALLSQSVEAWRGPKKPKLPKKERRRAQQITRRTSMRWLCLKPPERLKVDEQVLLEKLLAQEDEIALGYDLLQRFRRLLKDRDLTALQHWLADAADSNIPTFMSFANGIKADWAAVEAAFRLPWSNGLLEGHVNRVKLIKRQGYGRAKFDLLRRRVLVA